MAGTVLSTLTTYYIILSSKQSYETGTVSIPFYRMKIDVPNGKPLSKIPKVVSGRAIAGF